ncbi:MAG TPA: hypothetical protein VGD65_00250 [Chryseosolibacter sp.]
MSNNIFSVKRLQLLFKQSFIHNAQFLLFSTVAYVGVIFIVLSVVQLGNDLHPNGLENFQGFFATFVTVFGLLYVGHSFPAFRAKETTINYLMTPASVLEKFVFEFVNRICLTLLALPLLYWLTFSAQGYFFNIFTDEDFDPIGPRYLFKVDEAPGLIYLLITGGVLFALSLAFTGAAMFTKQPLVKSLFTVALVVMFFGGYSYIMIEHVGLGRYNPPERMMLVPLEEEKAITTISIALLAAALLMLFVAYRKLKEREA